MKILAVILACGLALLGYLYWGEHQSNLSYQAYLHKLNMRVLEEQGLAASNQQSQRVACAQRAAVAFKAMGYSEKADPSAVGGESFTDHYNSTLKRCLMTIDSFNYAGTNLVQMSQILDADERGSLGDMGSVREGTAAEKIARCQMKPPGKNETTCHSSTEWDAYVKSLME